MKKIIIAIMMVLALIFSVSACSLTADDAADPAYRTLRYEGGDVGGSKFKECVKEGDKLASNDAFYSYPNTQRQDRWDTDNFGKGKDSADYPDMALTDKNGVGISLKVTVPFTLNTSCDKITTKVNGKDKTYQGGAIQAYHEIFGKTRNGYFDPTEDGNKTYGDGWLWLMDTYISNCVVQQLTPKVRVEGAEDLWLKDEKRQALTEGLTDNVQTCVNDAMETDIQFYTIGRATVDKVTPDDQFTALYRERQEAETKAQTAQINKDAQIIEAQAQAAVAAEQAKVKQAEISAYGGIENYLLLQAIQAGQNPYQPQYIVGSTAGK